MTSVEHIVWKWSKMSHLELLNLCTIKIELSGNTVWPEASIFQKHTTLTIVHFGNFNELFFNIEWDFCFDF